MTLRMYANHKQLSLDDIEVRLRHERVHAEDCAECETGSGKIDRITRAIKLTGDLSESQHRRLLEIADRCRFSLDRLRYVYPAERLPDGKDATQWLRELTFDGARGRYGGDLPAEVTGQLDKVLALIDELGYAAYFLTVWDMVRFAREHGERLLREIEELLSSGEVDRVYRYDDSSRKACLEDAKALAIDAAKRAGADPARDPQPLLRPRRPLPTAPSTCPWLPGRPPAPHHLRLRRAGQT